MDVWPKIHLQLENVRSRVTVGSYSSWTLKTMSWCASNWIVLTYLSDWCVTWFKFPGVNLNLRAPRFELAPDTISLAMVACYVINVAVMDNISVVPHAPEWKYFQSRLKPILFLGRELSTETLVTSSVINIHFLGWWPTIINNSDHVGWAHDDLWYLL